MDIAKVHEAAAGNYGLVDRAAAIAAGGSDDMILQRTADGSWTAVHAGVYLIGAAPLTWHGKLRAATMAAGPGAVVSHRTAAQLWGLEGIRFAPIELTVPFQSHPAPKGVLLHRTRRRMERVQIEGIPVTPVERAILDSAWFVTTPVVELLYDSGIRKKLLTAGSMADCLAEFGTKGVRGRFKVAAVLDSRRIGSPLGSAAETHTLRIIRHAGIEDPVRQHLVNLPDGTTALLDFAWPPRLKAIEIDGLDAHATARQLELDLIRQNLLFEVGWQLRRFAARTVQQHPRMVAAEIARFLAA